jgi:hypothetical protein
MDSLGQEQEPMLWGSDKSEFIYQLLCDLEQEIKPLCTCLLTHLKTG